jgi:hypothetical protein
MLVRTLVQFTWLWAVVFLPIETYLTWSWAGTLLNSGYVVNVVGVGIAIWGALSVRAGHPYAEGVLATGWAWTTAVFWRGTNLRYWLAGRDEPLAFGSLELWLGPVFTVLAATALVVSLVVLVTRHRRAAG